MRVFVWVLLVVGVCMCESVFDKGDGLRVFSWVKGCWGDSVFRGCYGYVKVDSVGVGDSVYCYYVRFGFPTYQWWRSLFRPTYIRGVVRVDRCKPEEVSWAPEHFAKAQWLRGFELVDSSVFVRFLFPLLSVGEVYGRYDYFTVDVDSVLDLEFYGVGDSIMVGTFVGKEPDEIGGVDIKALNAIMIELTDSNPVRIKTVRFDSAYTSYINAYLGCDFQRYSRNSAVYGLSIVDDMYYSIKKPSGLRCEILR